MSQAQQAASILVRRAALRTAIEAKREELGAAELSGDAGGVEALLADIKALDGRLAAIDAAIAEDKRRRQQIATRRASAEAAKREQKDFILLDATRAALAAWAAKVQAAVQAEDDAITALDTVVQRYPQAALMRRVILERMAERRAYIAPRVMPVAVQRPEHGPATGNDLVGHLMRELTAEVARHRAAVDAAAIPSDEAA